MKLKYFIITIIYLSINAAHEPNDELPNLPENHLARYLNAFPQIKQTICETTNICRDVKISLENQNSEKVCWGFESDCDEMFRFKTPTCPDESGWVQNKKEQVETFYDQADFGYVKQQRQELAVFCEPHFETDSSLECTKYLRFCRGRNLLFDFRDLADRKKLIRYDMDVLKPGQMLGHCQLNKTLLKNEMDHMGALQSWAPELRNFEEFTPSSLSQASNECDVIIKTPTFIMKIDSTYNMYHHFCDFFNLYLSLFVNQTHPLAFEKNVRILIWESYPYDSPFAVTFKAFTQHPIMTLSDFSGKRVCFQNVVMPLLPRMIFGLYYNTPIIQGCQGSGLFQGFSEFILHRLKIPLHAPLDVPKVRITFLLRRTKYRKILNEGELLETFSNSGQFILKRVSFERFSFLEQLSIIRNTDILIGMHGAGLTHLLFLPNWATIFELYNCEDPNCYKDLARLRGVNYMTWERNDLVYPEDEGHHPEGGAHAKFTNYAFDAQEFLRLVNLAASNVKNHEQYTQYTKRLHEKESSEPTKHNFEKDEL